MKILVVDRDVKHSAEVYNTFVNDRGYKVDLASTFENTTSLYFKDKYEMIVIDFTTKDGEKSLAYILNIDSKQKIITQSSITGCKTKGCDNCIENHNRRRLVKQCTADDILNIVDKFDTYSCHYKNNFKT